METKRVRLLFKNDDVLREAQKSDGLNRCWVLLKPNQHRTIADITSHLVHAFQLHQSCPHGLLLSMDGFVLPPFESTTILKDKDLIRVRKKDDALFIEGHNAVHSVKKLKALEKRPVNSSVLLLSNVEFEKGKEVYESDDSEEEEEEEEEDEDEGDLLEDVENLSGVNVDSEKRQRKASEKLQYSMKKKHSEAPETVASDGHVEKIANPHQDGVLTKQKSHSQVEKKSDSNGNGNIENNEENAKLSDSNDDFIPSKKRSLELQENGKEIKDASYVPKETKKISSRSAMRKRAKRQWLREMAKIQKKNESSESENLKNWKEDQAKAERNKVDDHPRGVRNLKKDLAKAERKEVDGQPKGLLHWKKFPGSKTSNNVEKHQQQNQNINAHEHPNRNGDTSWQSNQYIDDEAEAVPVVVWPGHIRFGNVGKDHYVKLMMHVERGKNLCNSSVISVNYLLIHFVGRGCDCISNSRVYLEQIDLYSLVDVRIVKGGSSGPINVAPSWANGSPVGNENSPVTVWSSTNDKQTVVSSQEEQLSEENSWGKSAKVQLPQVYGWDKNANMVQPQHENSRGKIPRQYNLSTKTFGGNNAKKVQPPGKNSWGKQNAVRKPWSFKSSRGGAHGSTMSRWKNGN